LLRLKEMEIDPDTDIYSLGGSKRTLLALEAAYSKSRSVIVSTSGMDPLGIERLQDRIEKEHDNGILIELNYLTSKGREYLLSNSSRRFKKINVVPA